MTTFLLAALLITVLVIMALVLPLIRRRAQERQTHDQADLAAYRDRLAELRREHERGLLDEQELRTAEDELERELLQAHPANDGGVTTATPARLTALALALLIPLGGATLYLVAGNPGRLATGTTESLSRARAQQIRAMPVQQRIEALEQWVADNENSAQGWSLLAQAYREAEAFGDAATAFARARAAGADDAWLIARQAEALLLANNRRFTRGVSRLLEESLARDARNPLALMLSGQAALVDGDPSAAADYWRRLAETMPEDAPQRGFIEDLVARAEAAARGEAPGARSETPADAGGDATGPEVAVRVSVGDAVAGSVQPEDTVFVFARRPAGGGPPLAVARTRAGALPQRIVLDDDDSMAPQVKLSQAERVVVTARISRSGQAMPQSGDLEGSSQPVAPGTGEEVEVIIDRRIP